MTTTTVCVLLVICHTLMIKISDGASSDLPVESMYVKQCVVWQNISNSLEKEQNVELECTRNRECSGVDCTGKYIYKGLLSSLLQFEQSFCFGLVVESCSEPTSIHLYTVMRESNDSTTMKETDAVVDKDTLLPVQGAEFDILGGTARGFLDIKMNHTKIKGQPHIFLSIVLRAKMYTVVFNQKYSHYLSGFDVGIVNGMYIPVPDCDPHIANHTHKSGSCKLDTVSHIDRPGPKTDCTIDSMESCKQNEMCQFEHCVCLPDYIYDNVTQMCHQDVVAVFESEPDNMQHPKKMRKKNIVISVGCTVGVVIIITIVTVAVIRYRRYRYRYGQHQLLAQQDTDPEVV